MTDKIDLAATLATFTDPWQPRTVSEVHLLLIEPSGTPSTGAAATAAPRRVV